MVKIVNYVFVFYHLKKVEGKKEKSIRTETS